MALSVTSSSVTDPCTRCSVTFDSLFFRDYLFNLGLKSVKDDFQHDFAQKTDENDGSVVQAKL